MGFRSRVAIAQAILGPVGLLVTGLIVLTAETVPPPRVAALVAVSAWLSERRA